MLKDKVFVWGLGREFWPMYNLYRLHEDAGDYEIIAFVDKNGKHDRIDGTPVISPEEIQCLSREDKCIVSSSKFFDEIVESGSSQLGLSRDMFIKGNILRYPFFSWKEYLSIKKRRTSIVAEACYGGILSNLLDLRFNSPFVNLKVGIEPDDYYKLLNKLLDFMKRPPSEGAKEKYKNKSFIGWEGRISFPLLWYDDILLHGFHYASQSTFLEVFEKRRERFQFNDFIVFKILYNYADLEMFLNLPFNKKIGIFYEKVDSDFIITIPFENRLSEAYRYESVVNYYFKNGTFLSSSLNLFELLK